MAVLREGGQERSHLGEAEDSRSVTAGKAECSPDRGGEGGEVCRLESGSRRWNVRPKGISWHHPLCLGPLDTGGRLRIEAEVGEH